MTAFCFDLGRDRLAIASDTVAYELGAVTRVTGFTSKVFTIPRLRLMLCGRGVLEIAAQVHARLAVAPVADFGEAVELLPQLLREETEAWAAAHEVDDAGDRQVAELLFGGFDRQAGRARLFLAVNYRGFALEEYPAGAGIGCIPSLPRDLRPDLDQLPARDRLMSIMRAAREYFVAEARGGCVVGGLIELTTVSSAKISTREIGNLPVIVPISAQGDDDPIGKNRDPRGHRAADPFRKGGDRRRRAGAD